MPAKVAFMQLSSCGGCYQSLFNAHLDLLPILPQLDIVYWPAFVDFKLDSLKVREDGEIYIGLLEGVARTKRDIENAKLMRQKCSIIVAIGACPCYGSVAGLANLYDKDDLISRKFIETESITDKNPAEPRKNVPGFEEFIVNLKDIIDVDMFIPGCPPTTDNIIASILYLLTLVGEVPTALDKENCVCNTCNLKNDGCLLNQNILCYGSITAAGCDLMCPNDGDICYGCFRSTNNPGEKVKQLMNILSNFVNIKSEQAESLQHFLDLFLGASNITNFYFRGDLIQRLAYEPESFKLKDVKTEKGRLFALDVTPTGNKFIDDIVGTCFIS
jgi:F420-non-reducing hydrogenase small subunit